MFFFGESTAPAASAAPIRRWQRLDSLPGTRKLLKERLPTSKMWSSSFYRLFLLSPEIGKALPLGGPRRHNNASPLLHCLKGPFSVAAITRPESNRFIFFEDTFKAVHILHFLEPQRQPYTFILFLHEGEGRICVCTVHANNHSVYTVGC